jgi:ABC-type polysaccharide/polyol phosphate transport system ATPase subunit
MSASRLMVVVSHDLSTIQETCTRVLWMKRGRVVQEGDPLTVTQAYTEHVAQRAELRAQEAAKVAEEAKAA